MKFKQFALPLLVFLVGMIFTIFGGLLKILHWDFGEINGALLLTIGAIIKVIACVGAIITLAKYLLKGK